MQKLSEQLKKANLIIAGLEMKIETTQKELRVNIAKKPGTNNQKYGAVLFQKE